MSNKLKEGSYYKHNSNKHAIQVLKFDNCIYELNVLHFGYYPDLHQLLGVFEYRWQNATINESLLPSNEFIEITASEADKMQKDLNNNFKLELEKINKNDKI